MNRKLNIAIAATAVSLAFASATQAANSNVLDHMMDTCIQQFVTNNLADFQGKLTVKKSDSGLYRDHGPSLVSGGGSYHITVAAVGNPGGTQLATATCHMARDGSVISIKTAPIAAAKKMQVESEIVAKS